MSVLRIVKFLFYFYRFYKMLEAKQTLEGISLGTKLTPLHICELYVNCIYNLSRKK
jgi:hypothetical protein